MSALFLLLWVGSTGAALAYFNTWRTGRINGKRNFIVAMVLGAVGLWGIIAFTPSPSDTPQVAVTTQQTDSSITDNVPTDAPAKPKETEEVLSGDDATLSSADGAALPCFPDADTYQKFIDATVNKDRQAASDIYANLTSIPSGSAVHVIGVNLWKSYYEVRVNDTDQDCFVPQDSETVFRNVTHNDN